MVGTFYCESASLLVGGDALTPRWVSTAAVVDLLEGTRASRMAYLWPN